MDLSELEFVSALWEWIHERRRRPLIAYIRSDKPLRPLLLRIRLIIWTVKLNARRERPPGGTELRQIRFCWAC